VHRGRIGAATVTHLLRREKGDPPRPGVAPPWWLAVLLPEAGETAPPTVSVLPPPVRAREAGVPRGGQPDARRAQIPARARDYFEQTAARLLVSPVEPEGIHAVATELELRWW